MYDDINNTNMKPSKSMEHVGLVAWKLPCKGVAAIVASESWCKQSVCLLWKNIDISFKTYIAFINTQTNVISPGKPFEQVNFNLSL